MALQSSPLCTPLTSPRRHPFITSHFRASTIFAAPKARFTAKSSESIYIPQLQHPLLEYMSLPVSQYSVLDAERIERVDDNTFRCFVYQLKFFAFEICSVLLVQIEVELYGCCIQLLSCKLEGSPLVEAQNEKFSGTNGMSGMRHIWVTKTTSASLITRRVNKTFL